MDTICRSDVVVLGGDIFDFKWSRLTTLQASMDAAIAWVEKLTGENPTRSFYYLLGNHDCHPRFVSSLDKLTFQTPNLQWHPYWLRLGSLAFLHGDVLDGGLEHNQLEQSRRKHACDPVPQAYRHWLYDIAVQAKVHRVVATVAKRRNWVISKLSDYLSSQSLDSENGISDVYFGHTHRVIDNTIYKGIRFHNGGACIKGLEFRILEFPLK